jgi:acetyl esterase
MFLYYLAAICGSLGAGAAGFAAYVASKRPKGMDPVLFIVFRIMELFSSGEPYPSTDKPGSVQKVRDSFAKSSASFDPGDVVISEASAHDTSGDLLNFRIYRPKPAADDDKLKPVTIWFHGGGFVLGSCKEDDSVCCKIVKYAGHVVVSVEYRLAPENKFPAAIEDAETALLWTFNTISEYGGDPEQMYIAGQSAGGNIAAALTALSSDTARNSIAGIVRSYIKGLLVVYPCLEHGVYRDSHFRYSMTCPFLTTLQMQYFWSLYLRDQWTDAQDYRACPLRASDNILKKFPPTLVVLAHFDVLYDEGVEFAKRLERVGVPVKTVTYESVHGFMVIPGVVKEPQLEEMLHTYRDMAKKP